MVTTVQPFALRYRLTALVITVVSLSTWATPVAAHGLHASDQGVSLSTVVTVAALVSISAGTLAAVTRQTRTAEHNNHWISRSVGLIIIVLGVTAAGSVGVQAPITAAVGGAVGLTLGWIIVVHANYAECADLTAGVIGLHRLVEGVAVAGLWVAGTTVGVLGVVVFAGHMVIECVVIGMQQSFSRLRAIAAVVTVTGVFILGVGMGLVGGAIVPTQWIVAVVGGVLIPLGGVEFQSKSETRSSPTPA